MTKAIIEAKFCWDEKLVRPVTTISCGGEWMIETKVEQSEHVSVEC